MGPDLKGDPRWLPKRSLEKKWFGPATRYLQSNNQPNYNHNNRVDPLENLFGIWGDWKTSIFLSVPPLRAFFRATKGIIRQIGCAIMKYWNSCSHPDYFCKRFKSIERQAFYFYKKKAWGEKNFCDVSSKTWLKVFNIKSSTLLTIYHYYYYCTNIFWLQTLLQKQCRYILTTNFKFCFALKIREVIDLVGSMTYFSISKFKGKSTEGVLFNAKQN